MTVEEILANLPEEMSTEELCALLATLIEVYVDGPAEARRVLGIVIEAMREHYQRLGEECQCEKCVAERKRGAH
jgi:hypothetical protein